MKRNHNHGNRLGKQKTLLSFVKSLCNLTTRTEDSVRRGVRLGGTSVNAGVLRLVQRERKLFVEFV
uniref:Bm13153, isoform a n=1 Tax=Brugia malayi TaxID=6279 RepID=A0A0J9XZA2_BRUMA|nr:Bm13153, isoform a [Brugia malayi]